MSFVERRRFLWILLLVSLAALGIFVAYGNATTLARLSLNALVAQSTAIARVRCASSNVRWERGEMWTDTTFAVVKLEKGLLPGSVTVRTLGGSDGRARSHVDGTPEFRVGEELYLFLWAPEGQPFRVLGWSQGTFRIVRDPATGNETVTQDSASTNVFDPRTREFRHSGIRSMPVARFRQELQRAIMK